jgi:flagellar export protein FliJ
MPLFQFRLAPVLRLRERQRETQRLVFAAVEEQRLQLLHELEQLGTRLAAYAQRLAQEDGQDLTVTDLQLYGEFVQQLDRTLRSKRLLLRTVEEKREEQRLALLEADKEVKSLEQLRTRLEERHQHGEAATAQQQADEVGQRRYLARQRAAEGKGEN